MQLDKTLDNVLSKILDNVEAQTLSVDEALTERLSSVRLDIQRDVSFQLDSHVQKIAVSVEKSVRESLSRIVLGHGDSSEKERRILISVARNVAFLL